MTLSVWQLWFWATVPAVAALWAGWTLGRRSARDLERAALVFVIEVETAGYTPCEPQPCANPACRSWCRKLRDLYGELGRPIPLPRQVLPLRPPGGGMVP